MLLGELKAAESALNKIMVAELPIKLAYKFHKISKKISEENKPLEATRIGLVKKYGQEKKDGNYEVVKEKEKDFIEEFRVLMATEVDINFDELGYFTIDDLENAAVKLTPIDVSILVAIGIVKEK